MRWIWAGSAAAASCWAAAALGTPASATTSDRSARSAATACSPAPLHRGTLPPWAGGAPQGTPYALGVGAHIAAFFFRHPLRAGHPTSPRNKVLWIAARGSTAKTLKISARLAGSSRPVVRFAIPSASGSDNAIAFPSIIDLPQAGCWQLALTWRDRNGTIAIQVSPS